MWLGMVCGLSVVGHGMWAECGWAWYVVCGLSVVGHGMWYVGVVCGHSTWGECGTWDTHIDYRFEMW